MTRRLVPLWWWLIPLLLLTFWLGARRLDADAIWLDEYFSIYDAGGGPYGPLNPAQIWERVATRNPWHAPAYFVLLSGWGTAVGWEPAALRALSLLLGLLAIAWTYQLGRTMISSRPGLYAAAVLASSAFFVYYLHEVRMYALIALLASMTLWAYLRLVDVRQERDAFVWLVFGTGTALTLYTHYLAAAPLAAIALYHLLVVPKTRRWWQITAVGVVALALFLPWARHLLTGVGLAADAEALHDRALSTRQILLRLGTLFGNGSLVLLGITGVIAVTDIRRTWRLWFFALVTLAVLLFANRLFHIIPATRLRYLLSLWPLLALVVGIAVARLRDWPVLALALLAAWIALGIWNTGNQAFTAELASAEYVYPLHRIDDVLRERGQQRDFIVNYLPDSMAAITYDRTADFYAGRRGMAVANIEHKANSDQQAAQHADVLARLTGYDRVWLTFTPEPEPAHLASFRALLAADYSLCDTVEQAGDLRLELWVDTAIGCQEREPSAARN